MEWRTLLAGPDVILSFLSTQPEAWIYALLALLVFCETGLFLAPFLPEESLLFVAGTLAAAGILDVRILCVMLVTVNLLGESLNYAVGARFGTRLFSRNHGWLFNRRHIQGAWQYYHHHGGKTIVLAKFIPLIRTFTPFVAGMIGIRYPRFFVLNAISGVPWVGGYILCGFFLGNHPYVRGHLEWMVAAVVLIALLPLVIQRISGKRERKREHQDSFNPGTMYKIPFDENESG